MKTVTAKKIVPHSWYLLLIAALSFGNCLPLHAQEWELTTEQLKAFEGYYQFTNDPQAYLQFKVKDKGLVATQVWDGKEYFILPKSPLEFVSVVEKYPAKFSKDENGTVTQVLVFNTDVWKKVKNYTEPTNKVVTLSPQKLKAFQGKYVFEFQPGQEAYLQITAKEDHLMVKEMWTGNEMKFLPTAELEFYHQARKFPLKFTKDNKGVVTHVLAFNKDLWTKEVGK